MIILEEVLEDTCELFCYKWFSYSYLGEGNIENK